jgi:hypothetical protein
MQCYDLQGWYADGLDCRCQTSKKKAGQNNKETIAMNPGSCASARDTAVEEQSARLGRLGTVVSGLPQFLDRAKNRSNLHSSLN